MLQASPGTREYELICVVVNFGLGSRVLSMAKKNGITGGTIALGRGTVSSRIAEFWGSLMFAKKSCLWSPLGTWAAMP